MRRTVVLLLIAALGAMTLSGCTKAAVAGLAMTPVSPEIQTAYLAYWDAWLAANRTADPDSQGLAAHAAAPNLEVMEAALHDAQVAHTITVGSVSHNIRGMESFRAAHRVVDCVDLSKWIIVDERTGQPIHQLLDRPPQSTAFTLERRDGAWKVTHAQILGDC